MEAPKEATMMSRMLLVVAALAGSAFAAAPVGSDGLVQVPARTLDEVYVQPTLNLAQYRKVMVDPARFEFQKGWLKSINEQRDVQRWMMPDEQQRISTDAAAGLTDAVTAEFKGRGYEIVAAPGPGVLRLTPSATEVFLNAPDTQSPGIQRYVTHKDVGNATLNLEVRDSVSGALVARVVDQNTARENARFARTTDVSNQMWFGVLFAAWARNCATELETAHAAS